MVSHVKSSRNGIFPHKQMDCLRLVAIRAPSYDEHIELLLGITSNPKLINYMCSTNLLRNVGE